jgi:hypothetical protein
MSKKPYTQWKYKSKRHFQLTYSADGIFAEGCYVHLRGCVIIWYVNGNDSHITILSTLYNGRMYNRRFEEKLSERRMMINCARLTMDVQTGDFLKQKAKS